MEHEKELMERSKSPNTIYFKLKWHKFLIYFLLWFMAIACLLRGVNLLLGLVWGEYKEGVYSLYPQIHNYDLVFGILFIILACFIILTRFRLAAFHPSAVNFLQTQFVLFPLFLIFYYRAVNTAAGTEVFNMTEQGVEGIIISAAILIVTSHFYYKKRNVLFIK